MSRLHLLQSLDRTKCGRPAGTDFGFRGDALARVCKACAQAAGRAEARAEAAVIRRTYRTAQRQAAAVRRELLRG